MRCLNDCCWKLIYLAIGMIFNALPCTVAAAPQIEKAEGHSVSTSWVNALLKHVAQCWTVPDGVKDAADIQVRIYFELGPNGELTRRPVLIERQPGDLPKKVSASAMLAIERCEPYDFLPRDEYLGGWNKIDLTFSTKNMLFMASGRTDYSTIARRVPTTRETNYVPREDGSPPASSPPTKAQTIRISKVNCGAVAALRDHVRRASAQLDFSLEEGQQLAVDEQFSQSTLNDVRDELLARCAKVTREPNSMYPPTPVVYPLVGVALRGDTERGYLFRASWSVKEQTWTLDFPMREQLKLDEVRERLLRTFVDKHHVQEMPTAEGLAANPFNYKGKILGLRVVFQKMLSPTEGLFLIFTLQSDIPIVIANLPTKAFTAPNKSYLIAVRLDSPTSLRDNTGRYVDVLNAANIGYHECRTFGCSEFVN